MIEPGGMNAITDVAGIRVGNAEDADLGTGTTVVLAERPAIAACDIRGGAPATRATESLAPGGAVERADALFLTGGSSFGLDAGGGVMDWLKGQGRGFAIGPARVPIVTGAVIFDLLSGGGMRWSEPPWFGLGRRAAAAAGRRFALGNAGGGMGARAGALKGGLGTASFCWAGVTVGALALANPLGSVVIPGTRTFWAWWLERAGELGSQRPPAGPLGDLDHAFPGEPGRSTTLVAIATDADLTQAEALRVAVMAQDGLARAIRPVHTPLDGDIVFVLATGGAGAPDPQAGIARLGMLAADCAARAIARGVYEAEAAAGLPAYRDEA